MSENRIKLILEAQIHNPHCSMSKPAELHADDYFFINESLGGHALGPYKDLLDIRKEILQGCFIALFSEKDECKAIQIKILVRRIVRPLLYHPL